jgi:hypothetical protein
MIDDSELLKRRIELYAERKGRTILAKELGGGTDGTVWETTQKTAIKILRKPEVFANELECYKRLLKRNITDIHGFAVPRLIDYASDLLAIEMDVVEPPRILDFGKVRLDDPGDYSQHTLAYEIERQKELWEDHWPTIRRILSALRQLGIYYTDPNPYNITPENWDPQL